MVRCRDAMANSSVTKFRGEVFTHYYAAITVVCGIDCLACQDEFFMGNPIDIKENDEHDLDFLFACLAFFGLCEFRHFRWELILFPPNACLIIVRVSIALFPRFAQNLMLFLCRIHNENTSGQIHDLE
jgi:hypothetical protein